MYQLTRHGSFFIATASLPYKSTSQCEDVDLVIDTGAAMTIVTPTITDFLGYSAREHATKISHLDGAGGRSTGYVITVPSFRCLGFTLPAFDIACHDMDSRLGVSGLLGMNFLQHFRIDLDYRTGKIHHIARAVAAP